MVDDVVACEEELDVVDRKVVGSVEEEVVVIAVEEVVAISRFDLSVDEMTGRIHANHDIPLDNPLHPTDPNPCTVLISPRRHSTLLLLLLYAVRNVGGQDRVEKYR